MSSAFDSVARPDQVFRPGSSDPALGGAPQQLARSLARQLGSSPTAATLTDRAIDRYALAHDASHYLLTPQAVISPTDESGVAAVLRACDQLGVPLVFRSGGTSLSGQGQTDSLLVDTRRGFQDLEILDNGLRVRVQPGVTIRRVNAHLHRHGRKLGPDPASEIACTVGGVVANNSSGMQCGTTLNTYQTIESLVVVLPTGTVIDTGAENAAALLKQREPELFAGLTTLGQRVRDNPESVAKIRQLFAIKNTMGYGVNSFLDYTDPIEVLTHLMVGSEGTLGFIASATFRTVPVLPAVSTALLVFADLQQASESVPALVAAGTATAELLDTASLRVSQADRACPPEIKNLQLVNHAALLIELQAESATELAELAQAATPTIGELPLSTPAGFTSDPAARAALWQTRKGLYSAVVAARPAGTSALLEDIAVPVTELGQVCAELSRLFDHHQYPDSVIFGHAKDGNLHFLLNERFADPACMRRYESFTEDMVELVLGLGGTLKAEHGTGRIMAPFVEAQYGPELYQVMWEIKRLFDPRGLLNPGSVLSTDPRSYLANLKLPVTVEAEVDQCVECGFCEPVCPSRQLTLTPRQRIVVRRETAAARERGDLEVAEELAADYDYEAVQTCAADGMCATACPVHIDTGALVRRLRAEASQASPVDRAWSRAWTGAANRWDVVSRGAAVGLSTSARLPGLANTAAKLGRWALGNDRVPSYSTDLPPGGSSRARAAAENPDAVLFASCLGTMFGQQTPLPRDRPREAAAALLELADQAGIDLTSPPSLAALCCGTPWKSKGHNEGLAKMRAKVLAALHTVSRNGELPIVVEASSCAEGLADLLSGAERLRVVDAVSFTADMLLPHLTVTSRLPLLVVHPTCSTAALGSTPALVTIAHAIADEVIVPNDWGCCGFAGDRGMLHPELTASATAPEAAEVKAVVGDRAAAYASANRTCELGMHRATGQSYRHILELLHEATTAK